MKLQKIRISNILGIEQIEFKPDTAITVISGANGSGKTSVMEALKNVLQGGNDATLVRKGAEKGEIVLEFDDGTAIQKQVNGKAKLSITTADGKLSQPQSFIDKLVDMLSVNPIQFLTADKKNRTNILLESIPMSIDKSEFEAIVNGYVKLPADVGSKHAIEAITSVHKLIFDERTAVNRVEKEKTTTAEQMKKTLPNELSDEKNPESTLAELEKSRDTLEAKRLQYFEQFDKEAHELIEQNAKSYTRETDALRKKFDEDMAQAQRIRDTNNNSITAERDRKKAEKQALFESKHNPLIEQIGNFRQALKQKAAAEQTKEIINQMSAEAQAFKSKSEKLTEALKKLEELKLAKLATLPIKGLEVADGQIFLDGIIFDKLNTAKQIEIAIELAKLRAGKLGLVSVDGIERLDSATFETFKKAAEASGLQFIVTKVTDEQGLTINGKTVAVKSEHKEKTADSEPVSQSIVDF